MAIGDEDDDDQDEKLLEMLLNDPAPSSNYDEKKENKHKNAADNVDKVWYMIIRWIM